MERLSFAKGNAKLKQPGLYTFSLPAGWSCPGALECLAKADRNTGRILDAAESAFADAVDKYFREFRCFAASAEYQPFVRDSRWGNFELLRSLKSAEKMAKQILADIPRKASMIRIDTSGDLFSRAYVDAWRIAAENSDQLFYGYTKSFHLLPHKSELPRNLRFVASEGSRYPIELAREKGYSVASVVFSVEEAEERGLPIDHDDSHAMAADHDFALLLHGTQPKGSEAAAALSALKRQGHKGYSRKTA